jgi:hypothetical protein
MVSLSGGTELIGKSARWGAAWRGADYSPLTCRCQQEMQQGAIRFFGGPDSELEWGALPEM